MSRQTLGDLVLCQAVREAWELQSGGLCDSGTVSPNPVYAHPHHPVPKQKPKCVFFVLVHVCVCVCAPASCAFIYVCLFFIAVWDCVCLSDYSMSLALRACVCEWVFLCIVLMWKVSYMLWMYNSIWLIMVVAANPAALADRLGPKLIW